MGLKDQSHFNSKNRVRHRKSRQATTSEVTTKQILLFNGSISELQNHEGTNQVVDSSRGIWKQTMSFTKFHHRLCYEAGLTKKLGTESSRGSWKNRFWRRKLAALNRSIRRNNRIRSRTEKKTSSDGSRLDCSWRTMFRRVSHAFCATFACSSCRQNDSTAYWGAQQRTRQSYLRRTRPKSSSWCWLLSSFGQVPCQMKSCWCPWFWDIADEPTMS